MVAAVALGCGGGGKPPIASGGAGPGGGTAPADAAPFDGARPAAPDAAGSRSDGPEPPPRECGGSGWEEIWLRPDERGASVLAFAFDPGEPRRLLLVTLQRGIWRSQDGGLSWSPVAPELSVYLSSAALAFDPARPALVYASLQAEGVTGVYRSSDAGRTWGAASVGLRADLAMYGLGVEPAAIVLSTGTGIYRSTDGAASWQQRDGEPQLRAAVLASDPRRDRLFAGVPEALWVSRDAGLTWSGGARTFFAQRLVYVIAADGRGIVLAGGFRSPLGEPSVGELWRSADDGATWQTVPVPFMPGQRESPTALAFDPRDPSVVYLGTSGSPGGSAYKSRDGGLTWREIALGFHRPAVSALAVDPERPCVVYAATGGNGLFRSRSGGE